MRMSEESQLKKLGYVKDSKISFSKMVFNGSIIQK